MHYNVGFYTINLNMNLLNVPQKDDGVAFTSLQLFTLLLYILYIQILFINIKFDFEI